MGKLMLTVWKALSKISLSRQNQTSQVSENIKSDIIIYKCDGISVTKCFLAFYNKNNGSKVSYIVNSGAEQTHGMCSLKL